jgi:hypothetical protein
MRAGLNEKKYADWLLKLGDGQLVTYPDIGEDLIRLPDDCICNI